MTDKRLFGIASRIRELQQKIDDALWQGNTNIHAMENELGELLDLREKGELYGTRF